MLDLLTVIPSDQNVRGPLVARQQQLSINICWMPAPDFGSKPAGCRRCCRSKEKTEGRTDRRTDGRTDILPFYDALRILCEPRHNVNTTTAVTNMPFLQPQHVGKIRQYDLKDACESGLTQKRTDNVTVRCFHCGYTRANKLTRSQPPWLKRTLANLLSPTPTSHLREVSLSLALHESRLPCDIN